MRLRWCGAAVAVVGTAVLTAGCGSASRSEDPATWVGRQDHVASAETVPYDDPSEGSFLHVTLDTGLTDDTVRAVVHGVQAHFDDDTDAPALEVDVDHFEASVFPGLVTFGDGVSDPDLDRALWLRADGRATSYGDSYHSTVSSLPRVIAPAPEVAQLAIDFDAAVTHAHDVRGSTSVQSADGTTGVKWATAATLGFGLDPDVVGEFARLQRTHPGTTGWLTSDGGPWKAFIDFSPDDVGLAQVMDGSLLDTSRFSAPDVGWGPARAPADRFSAVFGDPALHRVLDGLRGVDGVAEIGDDGVVVRTGKAFAQVRAYAATSDRDLRISLLRDPVLYDFPTDPVFTSTGDDSARITALYAAVADLRGIARVDLSDVGGSGTLVVDDQVTSGELATVFDTLTGFPAPYRGTEVFASLPGEYDHDTEAALGAADTRGFTPTVAARQAHPDLVELVERAWDDARNR